MKKIICVTLAATAFFLSCKKDDSNTPSPSSSNTTTIISAESISRTDLYPENGYISGTVNAFRVEGNSFEKDFKYELDADMQTYTRTTDGYYEIHLSKKDKESPIKEDFKATEINFLFDNKRDTVLALRSYYISLYIDSSATVITKFERFFNYATTYKILTLSNVFFDDMTGRFEADYIIDMPFTWNYAQVKGKIKTKLTNVRYRENQ